MTNANDFPYDLKAIIKDCVLALFWPKKKIIEFLENSGCTASDLAIVTSPDYAHLKRPDIIEAVFYRISRRPDNGYTAFHGMLGRLHEWSYFDPYWFEREQKLDRAHAEERLAVLRKMVAARNVQTTAQRTAARKVAEADADLARRTALLGEFHALSLGKIKPQQRRYAFEKLLKRLFDEQGVGMSGEIRLVGEQIDGSFKFEGENYIVEAKWQDASISTEALYKFAMKADGKMYGRGLFISMNAYSSEGLPALVTGKHIKTILVDGEDLTLVLEGHVTLTQMLDAKIRAAQTRGDVYIHPVTHKSKARV